MLGERPQMESAGANVQLTISSVWLKLSDLDTGNVGDQVDDNYFRHHVSFNALQAIYMHEMPNISFASGGDADTLDFVAYVAKDTANERCCFVLECGGGQAQDVITTIGQAFELRWDLNMLRLKMYLNVFTSFADSRSSSNGLPGRRPTPRRRCPRQSVGSSSNSSSNNSSNSSSRWPPAAAVGRGGRTTSSTTTTCPAKGRRRRRQLAERRVHIKLAFSTKERLTMTVNCVADSVSSNLIDFNTELPGHRAAGMSSPPPPLVSAPVAAGVAAPSEPEYVNVNGSAQGARRQPQPHQQQQAAAAATVGTRDPFDMSELLAETLRGRDGELTFLPPERRSVRHSGAGGRSAFAPNGRRRAAAGPAEAAAGAGGLVPRAHLQEGRRVPPHKRENAQCGEDSTAASLRIKRRTATSSCASRRARRASTS